MNYNDVNYSELEKVLNEFYPEIPLDDKQKNELFEVIKKMIASNNINNNFELGKSFFEEGKKDLIRSKESYSKKDFSDSIYHLQQSSEKLMKGYGLILGFFSRGDLTSISHVTPKAFILMVENEKLGPLLEYYKKMNPSLNIDVNKIKKLLKKDELELAKLNKIELEKCLLICTNIDNIFSSFDLDQNFDLLFEILIKMEKIKKKPEFSSTFLCSMFIQMYIISIITYPHEAFTRYPDKDLTPNDYNEDFGIVKITPDIFRILEDSFDILNKFIEWKINERADKI